MKPIRLAALGFGCLLALSSVPTAHAWSSVRIGVGIGIPGPCWGYPYCYRPYYPVYVAPAPVVVAAPAPVVVAQPAAVVQPVPAVQSNASPAAPTSPPLPTTPAPPPVPAEETAPAPRPAPTGATLQPVAAPAQLQPVSQTHDAARQAEITRNLQLLADPDEGVRMNAVIQLGRLKAHRAIDPIAATLAGDRSPAVREAAARSLGLIGVPKGLPALQRAARMDGDHDVRRSAQFSIEIIQAR
jgi:hypothetical protein